MNNNNNKKKKSFRLGTIGLIIFFVVKGFVTDYLETKKKERNDRYENIEFISQKNGGEDLIGSFLFLKSESLKEDFLKSVDNKPNIRTITFEFTDSLENSFEFILLKNDHYFYAKRRKKSSFNSIEKLDKRAGEVKQQIFTTAVDAKKQMKRRKNYTQLKYEYILIHLLDYNGDVYSLHYNVNDKYIQPSIRKLVSEIQEFITILESSK